MNRVELIGRLTKDPDIRYTDSQMCIATFYLAIDRPSKEKATDYPCCKAFDRLGEIAEKYLKKGKQVAIAGHIQTGSYEGRNGTVYTTDVIAEKLELLSSEWKHEEKRAELPQERQIDFKALDEDVPF